MDLLITIRDEDGYILENVSIYQDGSDDEGARQIADFIRSSYSVDSDGDTVGTKG